ncbi:MAG: prefoldin subunit beta [Candidatus Lokiarchaeota archaeon]|nr:prefoldin subunit beta [Candidatus Lokiarchaeota archaeon]
MERQMPRALQDEFRRFQNMGQQLEVLSEQIFSVEMSLKDKDRGIEELDKCEEDVVVYKQVGGILLRSNKKDVLEMLKDEKLTLEMRKKTLERKEKNFKTKFEEMRGKLQAKMQNQ